MWWKLYFWILLFLTVAGSFTMLQHVPLTYADIFFFLIEIIALIGLYAYVYKKRVFSQNFWKAIFAIMALDSVVTFLSVYLLSDGSLENIFPFLKSNIPAEKSTILLGLVMVLPNMYAIYKLTFSLLDKKKK